MSCRGYIDETPEVEMEDVGLGESDARRHRFESIGIKIPVGSSGASQ
jgi:hypothetical protein